MLTGDTDEHIKYLEQGYHSICEVRVVVKCAKEVAPPPVDNKSRCYVQSYAKKQLFKYVTRWAIFQKTRGYVQRVQDGYTSYLSAWNVARSLQSNLGCELVTAP